jgi:hypothetical protein
MSAVTACRPARIASVSRMIRIELTGEELAVVVMALKAASPQTTETVNLIDYLETEAAHLLADGDD